MKKTAILIVLLTAFSITSTFARRKISYGKSEVLKVVADLPNTEKYSIKDQTDDGREVEGLFLDLGVLYEQMEVSGIPLWITQEPKIVGVNNFFDDKYYDLSDEEIDEILKENNLNKKELTHLDLTEKYLGWIVFFLVLVVIFLYRKFIVKDRKPDEIEYKD